MKKLVVMNEIINDILDINIKIHEDTKFRDIENWDSIVQMTFIVMVENEFKVTIEINDVVKAETIKDFMELVFS